MQKEERPQGISPRPIEERVEERIEQFLKYENKEVDGDYDVARRGVPCVCSECTSPFATAEQVKKEKEERDAKIKKNLKARIEARKRKMVEEIVKMVEWEKREAAEEQQPAKKARKE